MVVRVHLIWNINRVDICHLSYTPEDIFEGYIIVYGPELFEVYITRTIVTFPGKHGFWECYRELVTEIPLNLIENQETSLPHVYESSRLDATRAIISTALQNGLVTCRKMTLGGGWNRGASDGGRWSPVASCLCVVRGPFCIICRGTRSIIMIGARSAYRRHHFRLWWWRQRIRIIPYHRTDPSLTGLQVAYFVIGSSPDRQVLVCKVPTMYGHYIIAHHFCFTENPAIRVDD